MAIQIDASSDDEQMFRMPESVYERLLMIRDQLRSDFSNVRFWPIADLSAC